MIRNLLATTALATLLSTAAYAQDTTAPAPAPAAPTTQETAPAEAPVARADGHLATNLIGETVYNGTGDDAENIGEVNDMVVGANGEVESIVIGVGGFLGIGEKNVAVNYSEVDWAERDGDRWLVVPTTKEQLEAQADFDRRAYDPAPATTAGTDTAPATDDTAMAPAPVAPADPAAPADDQTATAPADPAAPADDQTATAPADPAAPADDQTATAPADPAAPADDQTATAPADPAAPADDQTAAAPADPAAPAGTDQTTTAAVDKSKLTEMPAGDISSENLVGTTVYGANDEMIGEIGDVVLEGEKVDTIIVDVGGFLGVGEKEVAVAMDNLAFMTDADGNTYLYTTFTKEQLDAQPAYDEATFAEKRDEQRLMMNQ
jgi:sporulation protein YlmC with PRC-barrel domain